MTDSATEDRQMALADADKTSVVIGFYANCLDPTFKGTGCEIKFGKPVANFATVMPAFKKAQEAKAAGGGTDVKTGATAMTTYAATLVAAIYALAF